MPEPVKAPQNPELFFSTPFHENQIGLVTAVTLRDVFAAAAVAGLMATWEVGAADGQAELAYKLADAMLERRQS